MKTLANEPISPSEAQITDKGEVHQIYIVDDVRMSFGLTKREHFAAMAMQGIASNMYTGGTGYDYSQQAGWAVEMADALIEALNKEI